MYVYLQAYEPTPTTVQPLVAFVTFYRGHAKAFETPPLPVTESIETRLKTVPLKFSISLAKLPPGRYNCQVTVIDPTGQKANYWQAPVMLAPVRGSAEGSHASGSAAIMLIVSRSACCASRICSSGMTVRISIEKTSVASEGRAASFDVVMKGEFVVRELRVSEEAHKRDELERQVRAEARAAPAGITKTMWSGPPAVPPRSRTPTAASPKVVDARRKLSRGSPADWR